MTDSAKHLQEPACAARVPSKPDQAPQPRMSTPAPELQSRPVRVPPGLGKPADILAMQQTVGNRAVMRMLAAQRSGFGSPVAGPLVQAKLADDPEEESIQRRREGQHEPSDAMIRSAAAEGIRTPATTLPHLDRIQASFGRHSVSYVQAHVGAEAAQASRAMNALAFASGDHVVFDGTPDLRTAAHEVAHVVQQRAGVQLIGGIGREGDAYERHADAVADAVVAGRSAEGLLEPYAAIGSHRGVGSAVSAWPGWGPAGAAETANFSLAIQCVGKMRKKRKHRYRPSTSRRKQGDHVFPWLGMKHTMENRLRGLDPETAAEDLIGYAESLTEAPGYDYAQGYYKQQLGDWIRGAKATDQPDQYTIDRWSGELLTYRNALPLSVTVYRRSSGGHGESTWLGHLQYYDMLVEQRRLTRVEDCAYDPVETAWRVCDYHPPTSVSDEEIAATLAQFIDSMIWAYPNLFSPGGLVEVQPLVDGLADVIDHLLDRVKNAGMRKAWILSKVDDYEYS